MCIVRAAQMPLQRNVAGGLWLRTIGDAHPAVHFDVARSARRRV